MIEDLIFILNSVDIILRGINKVLCYVAEKIQGVVYAVKKDNYCQDQREKDGQVAEKGEENQEKTGGDGRGEEGQRSSGPTRIKGLKTNCVTNEGGDTATTKDLTRGLAHATSRRKRFKSIRGGKQKRQVLPISSRR